MRHQVEHGHRVGRGTERHSHVTQLGECGVSHHPLDVVLDNPQKTHEQGRDCSNHHYKVQGCFAQFEQGGHASHHEDARSHPHMQGKLRRLAHGADEQADADHSDEHPVRARETKPGKLSRLRKSLCVVQRTGIGHDQADAQNKTKVTNTINQERFHVGEYGSRLVEPETDQQVGNQTNSLPAEKQLEQVVAHHQHQHGERKQGDVGKEPVVTFVFLHIPDGVEMNHQRHEGHDTHHHRRETVHQEANFHLQAAHGHPGVKGFVEASPVNHNTVEGYR
ncbi:MAG: hypothetical protein BWY72_02383 [Bacteroidetes bacterium ADurb.Bin416]|nr:MAG: hypothetical protein BWY72_02383 [Bacteroidetes bacterium ADurb.Bin416]